MFLEWATLSSVLKTGVTALLFITGVTISFSFFFLSHGLFLILIFWFVISSPLLPSSFFFFLPAYSVSCHFPYFLHYQINQRIFINDTNKITPLFSIQETDQTQCGTHTLKVFHSPNLLPTFTVFLLCLQTRILFPSGFGKPPNARIAWKANQHIIQVLVQPWSNL